MLKALAFSLLVLASASTRATIVNLYPGSLGPDSLGMQPGETRYVFFQALQDFRILELRAFGEPVAPNAAADMRWQLFETTAAWETTNEDRLFAIQSGITDVGLDFYSMPVPVEDDFPKENTLKASSYYRLSFSSGEYGLYLPYGSRLYRRRPIRNWRRAVSAYGCRYRRGPAVSSPKRFPCILY